MLSYTVLSVVVGSNPLQFLQSNAQRVVNEIKFQILSLLGIHIDLLNLHYNLKLLMIMNDCEVTLYKLSAITVMEKFCKEFFLSNLLKKT